MKPNWVDRSSSLVFFVNICNTLAAGMSFDYKTLIDPLWFTEVEEGKLSDALLPRFGFFSSNG